jgi:hypothetical protein
MIGQFPATPIQASGDLEASTSVFIQLERTMGNLKETEDETWLNKTARMMADQWRMETLWKSKRGMHQVAGFRPGKS